MYDDNNIENNNNNNFNVEANNEKLSLYGYFIAHQNSVDGTEHDSPQVIYIYNTYHIMMHIYTKRIIIIIIKSTVALHAVY